MGFALLLVAACAAIIWLFYQLHKRYPDRLSGCQLALLCVLICVIALICAAAMLFQNALEHGSEFDPVLPAILLLILCPIALILWVIIEVLGLWKGP